MLILGTSTIHNAMFLVGRSDGALNRLNPMKCSFIASVFLLPSGQTNLMTE